MKYLVTCHSYVSLRRSIPPSWNAEYLHTGSVVGPLDTGQNQYFAACDTSYTMLGQLINEEDVSFSLELDQLVTNKYKARSALKSTQGVPFTMCTNNRVDWPYDQKDKLIAKPVFGTRSKNVVITKHGETLPDIGEYYVVEKYIDDRYQRVSVDGYVCGEEIGIFMTYDNMYFKDEPTKFHYLGFPSVFHDDLKLKNRFVEVISELKRKTGCNNQIIDIEFFAVEGDFLVMEINPRISAFGPAIYEKLSGVNPWVFMEGLKEGIVHKPAASLSDLPTAVIRYNYLYKPGEAVEIEHDEETFSVIGDGVNETFSLTYRFSPDCKPTCNIIKELDSQYPSSCLL